MHKSYALGFEIRTLGIFLMVVFLVQVSNVNWYVSGLSILS